MKTMILMIMAIITLAGIPTSQGGDCKGEPKGYHRTEVCVSTSNALGGGTDGDVYIKLAGDSCPDFVKWYELDNPKKDDFESGNIDCFFIYIWSIGKEVKKMSLRLIYKGAYAAWNPVKVWINYNNKCVKFTINQWMYDRTVISREKPEVLACWRGLHM